MSFFPKSLVRYGLAGVATNGFLYAVFVAMIWLHLSPAVAAALCYILGVMLSYVLNRAWSFESQAAHGHDLPRFLFSYGIGFLATIVFILILTRWLRPEIAQIVNIGLTALVIYLCLCLTGFGKKAVSDAD